MQGQFLFSLLIFYHLYFFSLPEALHKAMDPAD
jgi:hypothetical protein